MCPRSMWTVLNEIGPQFERASGYRLNVNHDVAATLANRIIDGESFDVFIGPPAQMDRVKLLLVRLDLLLALE
jgi:ABC-type molybdate transport system substrate-binding protein